MGRLLAAFMEHDYIHHVVKTGMWQTKVDPVREDNVSLLLKFRGPHLKIDRELTVGGFCTRLRLISAFRGTG